MVDGGIVDEGGQGIALLKRCGIEERLDVGTYLAACLIDPVEFGQLEAETANTP